jgi:hypothetical protein
MEPKVPANPEAIAHSMLGLARAHRFLAITLFITGFAALWIARTVYQAAIQAPQSTAQQETVQVGVVIALVVYALLAAVHGVLSIWVARNIQSRKSYGLTVAIAIANILVFPFGTVVAVISMMTMFKPGVKGYFES